MTKIVKLESDSKMSNRQYHAHGRPAWWARIGSGDTAQFIRITRMRGDSYLDVTAEVPADVKTIYIGVGPNNHYGVRETITLEEGE